MFTDVVELSSAARRTGLAGSSAAMSRLCADLGVTVSGGKVDLGVFSGQPHVVDLEFHFTTVSSGAALY